MSCNKFSNITVSRIGSITLPDKYEMSVLKSLPAREYAAGMAEILKHGLIKDNSYYGWLVNNFSESFSTVRAKAEELTSI